jgi:YHS domain-containing protein
MEPQMKAWKILSAAAVAAALALPVSADPIRVVLKGHDPVAYFTEGKPVKGDAKFSYDFDDQRYHFASAKHRAMFVADPDKYVPQFGGYCTGSMSRGVRNEGNPEAWVMVDGKLYVFGAKDSEMAAKHRAAALADLEGFKAKVASAQKNYSRN